MFWSKKKEKVMECAKSVEVETREYDGMKMIETIDRINNKYTLVVENYHGDCFYRLLGFPDYARDTAKEHFRSKIIDAKMTTEYIEEYYEDGEKKTLNYYIEEDLPKKGTMASAFIMGINEAREGVGCRKVIGVKYELQLKEKR